MPLRDCVCCRARDPERAELDAWSASLCEVIKARGFDTAFTEHVVKIAEVSHSHPHLLFAYAPAWLRADPDVDDALVRRQRRLLKAPRPAPAPAPDEPVLAVVERDGTPVPVFRRRHFRNWGGTVSNTPAYTFVPRTKVGVLNVVRFARTNNRRVRCAGARHSWSDVYAADGDVLLSMLDPAAALPGVFLPPDRNPQDNELEHIQLDGHFTAPDGTPHARVRLGAAATSEHFRQWALSADGGNWQWMLPALPILVAITSAGWTQTICHGAGIRHQTVSDLCVEIEIVNCKGELQVIKDPDHLRAAAGGFGLMGVIVSHVFVLDPLKIAKLFPRKVPTPLAIPPVSRDDVPQNADFNIADYSDADLEAARKTFVQDANKFYSEWFWFPFQKECWVNVWDTEEPTSERPRYPDDKEIHNQEIQASLARAFEVTLLRILSPERQARLMGWAAMFFLPGGSPLPTSVCDALHFRRGIHRTPVRDSELSLEIPAAPDGTPDFSIVQKAWWMAISEVYAALPDAPMRTTLEMRIVGGSPTTMSTQRGNDHGTCAIEILSNTLVENEEWAAFVEKVTERWGSLKNPITGEALRFKPHHAKEWPRKIRGMPVMNYLQEVYKTDIPQFKNQLQAISQAGGCSFADSLKMFGNDTILELIGEKR